MPKSNGVATENLDEQLFGLALRGVARSGVRSSQLADVLRTSRQFVEAAVSSGRVKLSKTQVARIHRVTGQSVEQWALLEMKESARSTSTRKMVEEAIDLVAGWEDMLSEPDPADADTSPRKLSSRRRATARSPSSRTTGAKTRR
jgi:hypothetical protein